MSSGRPRLTRVLPVELVVALIAAVFGLLGVLAGGAVTYWSNRQLQDRDNARTERLELQSARATAAFESSRLNAVEGALSAMTQSRRFAPISAESMRPQLPIQEMAVMLAHLDAGGQTRYNDAQNCIAQVRTQPLPRTLAARLDEPTIVFLGTMRKCVLAGEQAVGALVREAPPPR